MNSVTKGITEFLKKHHVATLATVDAQGAPYCCNIFYAYDENDVTMVFASDSKTAHVSHFIADSRVAVSVVLESKIVGILRGTQICGVVIKPEGEELEKAKKRYFKRFPYAAPTSPELWVLKIESIKHTDNRLGFGVKQYWNRNKDNGVE